MKASHAKVGIGRLCMLFGKTRHAYYDRHWRNTLTERSEREALQMVALVRREIPRIGTAKLHYLLKVPMEKTGIKMGRDALHELLTRHGLTVRGKKRRPRTTDSNHPWRRYPNLLKGFCAQEAEQAWAGDITYLQVGEDFHYLSLLTDIYSHRIAGYCLHPTLAAQGPLQALHMALKQRIKPHLPLIHHSDRGSQYCSGDYVLLLQKENIQISMTEKGDPYENALAERINGILKTDFDLGRIFDTAQQAQQTVEQSIRAYNEIRPHMSCDNLTPEQAHQMKGALKKRWKPKTYQKPILST
jgi:transposase InsO family protein